MPLVENGKILGVPKKPAIIIGAGGVVFLGYMWWRNGKATDPVDYVDPDSVGATEYESPLGNTGTNSTGSFDDTDPDRIDTNAKWTQYATDLLESSGWERSTVALALGKLLLFQPLTPQQVEIAQAAKAMAGEPPVGGPYPIKETAVPPAPGAGTNKPGAITGLKVIERKPTSVKIDWQPAKDATHYQFRWGNQTRTTAGTQASIGGLKRGGGYSFYVAAKNNYGTGPETHISTRLPTK